MACKQFVGIVLSASILLVGCSGSSASHKGFQTYPAASQLSSNTDRRAQTYAMGGDGGYQSVGDQSAVSPVGVNKSYYFSYDGATLSQEAQQHLVAQARYLLQNPKVRVRLEGNTDDRGSREYNIGLGWRRDQTVAHFLEAQGVPSKQITMVSYGKERPKALGDTEQSWSKNRRVDLVIEAYQ